MEGLCVLTHLRDQLEAMGGQTVRAGEENGSCRGSDDDEDFGRWDGALFRHALGAACVFGIVLW